MKYYIRLHCDNTFGTMCDNIVAAMGEENLPLALIRRYARSSFAYLFAYRDGKDIVSADEWVKKHRSHRRHSNAMDSAIDQIVNLDINSEYEKLYYPFGRNPISVANYDTDGDSDEEEGENLRGPIVDLDTYLKENIDDDLNDLINSDDEEGPIKDQDDDIEEWKL